MKNNNNSNSNDTGNKNSNATANDSNSKQSNMVKPLADAAADLPSLLVDSLKDIYWAENALLKALPKMAENATAPNLTSAIEDHIKVTKNQVTRLEKAFELLGEKAEGKKCEAMAGLIKEGEGMLEETQPGLVRDMAIIAASQKVEHYEIATYGTLRELAKKLGENEVAQLMAQTLAEEKESDCILTDIASDPVKMKS